MTQSAAEAAADEALRAAKADNLRDESSRRLPPQRDRHTIIYNDPPPWW